MQPVTGLPPKLAWQARAEGQFIWCEGLPSEAARRRTQWCTAQARRASGHIGPPNWAAKYRPGALESEW